MTKISDHHRKILLLPFMAGAVLFLSGCVEQLYDAPLVQPPTFHEDAQNSSAPATAVLEAKPEEKPKKVKPKAKTATEALLSAEGNWNLVEETSSNDPALAHQRARDKVDPRRRNVMSELSPHFTPGAKSGEDGKMRVLQLEPNDDAQDDMHAEDGFEVAETSISKPTQKVVKPEIASKINAFFAGEKTELLTEAAPQAQTPIITPAKKPVPQAVIAKKSEPKKEKSGGFFDKIASVFSSDDEDAAPKKQQISAPKSSAQTDNPPASLTIGSVAEQADDVRTSAAGKVLPPQTPSRKRTASVTQSDKVAVVVASNSTVTKSNAGVQDMISIDAAQNGQVHSIGMRAAIHPSKTRLAFDFSGAVKYKVAIDQIRNVLRIKFDDTSWDQDEQGSLEQSSKLLGSYVVRKQADGSVIFEVRLRQKSTIKDTMILRPGVSPHHRVVVDLQG